MTEVFKVKHKRIFGILAVAVVLSLLILALPAITASAAPIITLSVEKGGVGDKITVEGNGFNPSIPPDHLYDVDIYFSSDVITVGDEINYYNNYYALVKQYVYTDDRGGFSKIIEIPAELSDSRNTADVHGGTYYFYITDEGNEEVKAYAEFTVIGISTLDPESGPVGTEVSLSGIGFDANNDVQVSYDGDKIDVTSGDRRFKSNGSFSSKVYIPASTSGEHVLAVEDNGGHIGQVKFTVEPEIDLSPSPASAGEELTITGSGFGGDADLFVYFDGDVVYITGDYDTNYCGGFVSKFIVPEVETGSYLVEVEDNVFNGASAMIDVGPGLVIIPETSAETPANVGDSFALSGTGFLPSHELTITYASETATFTTTSLTDGSFEYLFTVPASSGGEHTITVTDGTNTQEISFFVESTPPEAPAPLLPEMDTKAKSEAEFDWTDVSDPSLPISYELQVATNSQFTPDSILVNKIGLTTSSYTLDNQEKLESTSEDAPYYWRVRAKDAASNQSPWTSGTRFTVGGGFSMPGWLMYTLIAIGVVLVFFLGLWLGRRATSSEDYW
jgi:hypothetical protein